MNKITASQLFANYTPTGEERCFFCGGSCNSEYTKKKYVKDTFTNRDIVKCPGSDCVCYGCVKTLEDSDILLCTGETRTDQRMRMYTWIYNKSFKYAFTKSHIYKIREYCINPPDPQFVISIATSGQKQLLFRASVSFSKSNFPILLEDETIIVNADDLIQLLTIAESISRINGKISLTEMTIVHAIKYYEHYNNLDNFNYWKSIINKPLTRLAAFLSPSKEELNKNERTDDSKTESVTEGNKLTGTEIQTCMFN